MAVAIGSGCGSEADHTIASYGWCRPDDDGCIQIHPRVDTGNIGSASFVEDGDAVRVEIFVLPHVGDKQDLIWLELDEPLGDRVVIDALTGEVVPFSPRG